MEIKTRQIIIEVVYKKLKIINEIKMFQTNSKKEGI